MTLASASLLTGLASGLVSILSTMSVEKLGGILGGLIATLPSTIIPSSITFALQNKDNLPQLMLILFGVPIGFAANTVFMLVFRYSDIPSIRHWPSSKALLFVLFLAFLAWFFVATVMISFTSSLLLTGKIVMSFACLLFQILIGIFLVFFRPIDAPKAKLPVTPGVYALRGAVCGGIVGSSVIVAHYYPKIGGIFSTFPALMSVSMVSLWMSHGADVPRGAAAPMLLGSASVPIYSVSFTLIYRFIAHDIPLCVVGGIFFSLCYSSINLYFMRRMALKKADVKVTKEIELEETKEEKEEKTPV